MFDDELLEHLDRHAGAAREVADRGVVHLEQLELATQVRRDDQAVSLPEVFVVAQHPREGEQERRLQVGRRVAVGHVLDVEALIDQPEEAQHVVREVALAGPLDDLGDAGASQGARVTLPGAEVAVEPSRGLVEGDAGDQVTATHVLRPRDPVVQHELRLLRRHLEHQGRRRNGLGQVAQDDVRVEPRLTDVERLEACTLPGLGRVEVHDDADVGHEAFADQLFASRLALEPVDDVDVVVEDPDDLAVLELFLRGISTHAEVDVGNATRLERLLEGVDLAGRQDLTLVDVRAELLEVEGIDDTPQHDRFLLADDEDVERSIDDANHVGSLSFR